MIGKINIPFVSEDRKFTTLERVTLQT